MAARPCCCPDVGSREQAIGIDEVNKAVMNIDQLTQENSALVEEASAATRSLADHAVALTELVGRFELGVAQK